MTRALFLRRRLARSMRVKLGVLLLAFILLPAVFAELLIAAPPIVAIGPSGTTLLPAIVAPEAYRGLSFDEVAARHRDDHALWPLWRHGPTTLSAAGPDASPSWQHPLGTDWRQRDRLARLVYGARPALGLALAVVALSLLLGVVFGTLAGYFGGFYEELLARPVELIEAFPAIVVVALVRTIRPDGGLWPLLFAIAAVRWAEVARLTRVEVARLRGAEFVLAARALGCSRWRILSRHVLPHATRPLVVSAMFGVASVVLLEVALSFLGLGASDSWGVMMAEGLAEGASLASTLWAGLALALTVTASYLLADALEEALDARVALRER